jgi:hypothetical protein
MMDSTILQRNARPLRYEAATHLFTAGQIVRLKGGFGLQSQSADTYRITATLPPRGDSQQYRIRNDGEHYERVATQDSLEPVSISPAGPGGALIEGTFGAGQVIETQQSPDHKSRSRRKPGPSLKAQEIGWKALGWTPTATTSSPTDAIVFAASALGAFNELNWIFGKFDVTRKSRLAK